MPLANVIQGCFPNGLPRFASGSGFDQQWQAQMAIRRASQPVTQARAAQPQANRPLPNPPVVRPRPAAPHALQLPVHFAARVPFAGGQPLPLPVRQMMEAAFNTSFADVRVHVGPNAASIGAIAFTHGTNVHFAPGQFNPQTQQGRLLLAHELSHVVQQRTGRVRNPFGSGLAVVQEAALEAEAHRMAMRATSRCAVAQLGRGKPKGVKAKSRRHTRTDFEDRSKQKFLVVRDPSGNYVVTGRPPFSSLAKNIKVRRTGMAMEDRRHIIPYHRLRAVITKAASLFEKEKGADGVAALRSRIATLIAASGSRRRTHDVASLIKTANSNPRNLFPEDAAENQAIEKIRSMAKKTWADLENLYVSEYPPLATVKSVAKDRFAIIGTTPITLHMAYAANVISLMIDFATSDHEVFEVIKSAERSTELDISKATNKAQTAAAMDLNNRMAHYLLEPLSNGAEGLDLIESFFKLPAA